MSEEVEDLKNLMVSAFDIHLKSSEQSFDELFPILYDHVEWMMEHRMEALLSTLYRLDIDEQKINSVLSPDFPVKAAEGITNLILFRQKERHNTKVKYRNTPYTKDWIDLD